MPYNSCSDATLLQDLGRSLCCRGANMTWTQLCEIGIDFARHEQHHAACFCLTEALQQPVLQDDAGAANPEEQLALLYNVGLQHLLLGRHAAALACFRGAAPAFLHQPLLWLRMAECALGMTQSGADQRAPASDDSGVAAAAAAEHEDQDSKGSAAQLSQVSDWLRTALTLTIHAMAEQPPNAEQMQELRAVQQAALLNAAHVELRLGNHLVALQHVQTFLARHSDAAPADMIAAQYLAAECLAGSGRPGEAVDVHLAQALDAAASAGQADSTQQDLQGTAALLHANAACLLLEAGGAGRADSAAKHAAAARELQPELQAAALLLVQSKLLSGNVAGALQALRTPLTDTTAQ